MPNWIREDEGQWVHVTRRVRMFFEERRAGRFLVIERNGSALDRDDILHPQTVDFAGEVPIAVCEYLSGNPHDLRAAFIWNASGPNDEVRVEVLTPIGWWLDPSGGMWPAGPGIVEKIALSPSGMLMERPEGLWTYIDGGAHGPFDSIVDLVVEDARARAAMKSKPKPTLVTGGAE